MRYNYFLTSIYDFLTPPRIIESTQLLDKIQNHGNGEAYHCVFDLCEYKDNYIGYTGPVAPALGYYWLDFDHAESGGLVAQQDLQRFIKKYQLKDYVCFFSGKKGFSLGIPCTQLPFEQEGADIPEKIKSLVVKLSEEFKTLDTSIYAHAHKLRAPGSRHPDTGLFKILADAFASLEEIKKEAKNKPKNIIIPTVNLEKINLNYGLNILFESIPISKPGSSGRLKPSQNEGTSHFRNYKNKLCIEKILQDGVTEERNNAALRLTTHLYETCVSKEDTFDIMFGWCERFVSDDKQNTKSILAQIERIYSGKDSYSFTCLDPMKASRCSAKCELRALLKPENRPPVDDETSPNSSSIVPLGHKHGAYYFVSSSNKEITEITQFSETDFLNLEKIEHWEEHYGITQVRGSGKNKSFSKTIPWQKVKSDLMEKCRSAGVFTPTNIRGIGTWLDFDKKIIIHLGDRLFYDGIESSLDSVRALGSKYVYELSERQASLNISPLDDNEMNDLLNILHSLNYSSKEQEIYLGGWIVLSCICGVLDWRPHIWITGEAGAGKSTVVKDFLKKILPPFSIHVKGATTEAGLRQSLKSSCVPVLFDEFDTSIKNEQIRIQKIIELFRQASSLDSGDQVKGSATGESIKYVSQFIGAVSSIYVNLMNQADKTRFTLINLKKNDSSTSENNTEKWEELSKMLSKITPEYSQRFFARIVKLAPIILKNKEILQKKIAKNKDQRLGQQYGSLLAGWTALLQSSLLLDHEADLLISKIDFANEEAGSQEKDQIECLNHLLESRTRFTTDLGITEFCSISDLIYKHITTALNPLFDWDTLKTKHWRSNTNVKDLKEKLNQIGLIVCSIDEGPGVLIRSSHPELKAIFKETSWYGGWNKSLARLPGAKNNKVVRDTSGKNVKGVFIPVGFFTNQNNQ